MSKIVNAALCYDSNQQPIVIARVSPVTYRYAKANGSFSNAQPGDAECEHMSEAEARQLVTERPGHDYRFSVPALDKHYQSRIKALGAAVLHARGKW